MKPWSMIADGETFGRLTVLGDSGERTNNGQRLLRCVCECGNEKTVPAGSLRAGVTRSCGCLNSEASAERARSRTRHGHSRARDGLPSRTYASWMGMIQRCTRPGHPAYHRYGGRGITICPLFRNFDTFLAFMGERPEGLTLDRADNDHGYDPINCRWVSPKEQANNRQGP